MKGGDKMKLSKLKIDIAIANSGYSMQELAKRAGVSRQRWNVLTNQKETRPVSAGKIARALGVDVTELLED